MAGIIVLGPQVIIKFFAERVESEKIQAFETIPQFISAFESGTVDNDVSSVVIHYNSCENDDSLLCEVVASLSSEACVSLIVPKSKESDIKQTVSTMVSERSLEPAPFYFLSQDNPISDLQGAIGEWNEWQGGKNGSYQDIIEQEGNIWDNADFSQPVDLSQEPDVGGFCLCVTSSKGGSGKSTVSLLVGSQIAKSSAKAGAPAKVCVVDMDVKDSQIGLFVGASTPTVTNLVSESPESTMFTNQNVSQYVHHCDVLDIDCVLAPRLPNCSDSVPAEFYTRLIEALKRMYDVVILDTSVDYWEDRRLKDCAYPLSDAIICVTSLARQTLFGLGRWFKVTTTPRDEGGLGIEAGKIGIVVNRSHEGSGFDRKSIYETIRNDEAKLLGAIPDIPASVADKFINMSRMDLFLTENEFGFGSAVFKIASMVSNNIPLVPLVMEKNSKKAQNIAPPAQTRQPQGVNQPQAVPQYAQVAPEPKRGFFARLFGK